MKAIHKTAICIIILCFIFLPACRRNPSNPPTKYAREIAETPPPKKEEKWLPDKYPWEGKKSSFEGLPERLIIMDKKYELEMKMLDRVVHGPPKCEERCRRRCCYEICPNKQ